MGMTDRSGRRVRTSCRLAYVGVCQDIEGEAQTLDLSFSGCRATCPLPPPVGTKLHVSVYLPGMEHPLSIELAVVRWVRHTMVGIRFSAVSPPHRERLLAWIMKAPFGGSTDVRTKPCLGT
jgi:hypothetical protein